MRLRRYIGFITLCALAVSKAEAQSLAPWEQFDFAHKRVDSASIDKLPLASLRSLRGIVFGRHGRPFTDEPDVQSYLKSRSWYKPDTAFSNQRLSAMEKANLDVIRAAEARKHPQIETGDMRFYRNRVVTSAMLGHHTAADWQLLDAEIGAAHGERFDSGEPDDVDANGKDVWALQKYFDERYWYRGRENYSTEELSAIEKSLIQAYRIRHPSRRSQRPCRPWPGDRRRHACTSALVRIASRLGLQRRQRDVTPTVEEYLGSRRQELPS